MPFHHGHTGLWQSRASYPRLPTPSGAHGGSESVCLHLPSPGSFLGCCSTDLALTQPVEPRPRTCLSSSTVAGSARLLRAPTEQPRELFALLAPPRSPHFCLGLSPGADVSAHAAATRSRRPERGAEDGVAAEGAGAGPCGTQVPVRERGALVLCANGGRERRLYALAGMTVPTREALSLETGTDRSPPRTDAGAHVHPSHLLMNPWSEKEEASPGRTHTNTTTIALSSPRLPRFWPERGGARRRGGGRLSFQTGHRRRGWPARPASEWTRGERLPEPAGRPCSRALRARGRSC